MAKISTIPPSMTPQDALAAVMVAVSASDQNMTTPELLSINRIIDFVPIFVGYDKDRLKTITQTVADLFEEEDGLDALFGLIRDALPEKLFETAYALACDVGAADGRMQQQELRFLEEIRYQLDIDRLHGAAIERGARARHMLMPAE